MRQSMMTVLVALLFAVPTFAAKSYQVTGVVKEVSATSITVAKGKEMFEVELGGQATAGIKAGDKVTVKYSMTATAVEKK